MFISCLMQDKNLKIGKDSLETAVSAIRHHHHLKQQQKVAPPVTATPGAPPSDADTSPEYDLVLDGYLSVVLVTEAAAKCLYLRDHELNPGANQPMEKYCKWFLERLKHGGEISEVEKKHIVKKLIGIRNALSHANAQYDYLPHDPATLVPMFILYEQIHQKTGGTGNLDPDEADYREVQRYTMRQFADLCAIMREVFLSWKLIDPDFKQEPQIGAREVQMAVMGRYESVREIDHWAPCLCMYTAQVISCILCHHQGY